MNHWEEGMGYWVLGKKIIFSPLRVSPLRVSPLRVSPLLAETLRELRVSLYSSSSSSAAG
jgi:hypothetical protein